jgi:hypothetical protein
MKRFAIVLALAVVPSIAAAQQGDFGDAPEQHPGTVCFGVAYPDLGVYGNFPTCITTGFECGGSFVLHTAPGIFWLGPTEDAELDGNAGLCATGATFPVYDADECYADGDAGLISPQPYTIVTGGGYMCGLGYSTCAASNGSALGNPCGAAPWTVMVSAAPGFTTGFMNILVDWTQNGDWCDFDICGPVAVPEHVLVNMPVGPGIVVTPPLPIGAKPGYHWARITLTRTPITATPWDGSGVFDIGETEDYLIYVNGQTSTQEKTWGSIKSLYRSR